MTLPEALAIVKCVPEFWVDFKTFNESFCEQVLRQFDEAGIDHGRIMCATYTIKALEYLKTKHPEIRRIGHMDFQLKNDCWTPSFSRSNLCASAVDGEPYSHDLLRAISGYAKQLGLWGVNMAADPRVVTPGLITELKRSGLWVSIALIHTDSQAEMFARHGHDCVVTRDVRTVRPIMDAGARGQKQ